MFPWLWFWSPHLQYPFGGDVAQDYKPATNWGSLFFGSIKPKAGNGQIEQETFTDVASYGKQLGLITEVIMNLVEKAAPALWKELEKLENLEKSEREEKLKELKRSDQKNPLASLARLKIIQNDIEEIKKKDLEDKIDKIVTVVKELRSRTDQKSIDKLAELRGLFIDQIVSVVKELRSRGDKESIDILAELRRILAENSD